MSQKSSPYASKNAHDKSARKKINCIKTVIRMRGDVECEGVAVTKSPDGDVLTLADEKHTFTFDCVLDRTATQKDVYNAAIRKFVPTTLHGQNCCMLAYGQTGSGKTHSMMGTVEDPGVLPLFARDLFNIIEKRRQNAKVVVKAAFYEVYSEKVYDLLCSTRTALNFTTAHHIAGLTRIQVQNFEEIYNLQAKGLKRRITAATVFNAASSRSHAMFEVNVHQELQVDGNDEQLLGRCFFVDLAGNEKSREVNESQWDEGININKSLLALHRVVSQRASKESHVAYRESLLTRILEPCIAGNANVTVLGAICPTKNSVAQTINTLQLVSTARRVVMKPRSNRDNHSIVDKCSTLSINESVNSFEQLLETIKSAEKKLVLMNRPNGDCIVELFPETLKNKWHLLYNGFVIMTSNNEPIVTFSTLNSSGWFVLAQNEGVDLNNVDLKPGTKTQLNHADCIVLNESRFFVVSLNDNCELSKFKYEVVKMNYMEAISDRIFEKIKQHALVEAKAAMESLDIKLKAEIATLQADLLMMKQANTHDDKKAQVKLQHDIEDTIKIREELSKHFGTVCTINTNLQHLEKFRDVSNDVNNLNKIFTKVGLPQVMFVVFLKVNQKVHGIRVSDKRIDMYANVDDRSFEHLKDKISHVLSISANDLLLKDQVIAVLYQLELHWMHSKAFNASPFLQEVVPDCIERTATRRKSTISEVTANLKKRNSVLASIVTSTGESASSQILKMAVQYFDMPPISTFGKDKSPLLKEFLKNVSEGYRHLNAARYKDVNTNQKQAVFLANAVRFRNTMRALATGVNVIIGSNFYSSYHTELTQISQNVINMPKMFNTFLRHVNRGIEVSSFYNECLSAYQHICQTVGCFLFWINEVPPKDFHNVASFLYNGFTTSVDLQIKTLILDTNVQPTTTFAGFFRHISVNAVKAVRKSLGTFETFNAGYYRDVMIPAFKNWDKMMGTEWKSQDPSLFYKKILKTISNKYSNHASDETVRSLQNIAACTSDKFTEMRTAL